MEELKHKVKKHSIKVMIIWLCLMVVPIVLFMIGSINIKSLTSYCSVKTEEDLNRCFKENPYVEIHTNKVYNTGYNYVNNNKTVARFTDVEIEGYWMISLMNPKNAEKWIQNEHGDMIIKGKLEKFNTKTKSEGYHAIKEKYVEILKEEMTREEVMNNFTLVQFNEYNGDKVGLYIWFGIGLAVVIVCFLCACRQIPYIRHPERYKLNKNISLQDEQEVEKVVRELEHPIYQEKNMTITEHYLIFKTAVMQVSTRENVCWIYEKVIKQNGITTGKCWVVYSLDQKNPYMFSGFGKKHCEMEERLQKEFPNATFGYSEEANKLWNKNPEQLLKEENK